MMKFLIGLAAVLALGGDEKSELLAAAKKAGEAKSYAFRGETKLVLPEGLDRAGGGDAGKFEGKFERDAGAWVKTGAFEFVTAGGKTAARPVAEWCAVKDEGTDVQRLLYLSLAGARAFRPPLEDFASWSRGLSVVKRTDAKEKIGDKEGRLYEVEFNREAARDMVLALFPMGPWMDRMPIDKQVGTARVWIDGEARILKLDVAARVMATIQGAEVQLVATRTSTITGCRRNEGRDTG
jgi:hypothetical protein